MAVSQPIQYGEVPVGLVDSVVLPGNPLRRSLLISNPGPNPVWISFGQAAVANRSLLIPTNIKPLVLDGRQYPGLLQLDLHAITVNAPGFLAGLSELTQVQS